MNEILRVERSASGGSRVAGQITVGNAAVALAQGRELGTNGVSAMIDIAELQSADSVTLAVLLAWAAQARRNGGSVAYVNISSRLRAIAHLGDAESLLGFDSHA